MASESYRDFDSLEPVAETGYDDSDDDAEWIDKEDLDEPGWTIVGELVRIQHNCGEHDSTIYELKVDLGENRVFWARASMMYQIENSDIDTGDVIGIRNTGETYEANGDEAFEYEVRKLNDGGD